MNRHFFMIMVMMLSLTACGSEGDTNSSNENSSMVTTESMTKDEMLKVAESVSENEMGSAIAENIVKAKQTYCGKVLKVKAPVSSIREDSVIVGQVQPSLVVYLPEEDIAELQPLEWITIVGITDEDIQTETLTVGGTQWELRHYVMEDAYFVTNRYEHTGIPKSENESYKGAWNVEFPGQSVQKVVYFDESIDVSQYVGEEITFTIYSSNDRWKVL